MPAGIIPTYPDLAVEVVSPTDRKADVMAKVSDYLAAGVQVVWVAWSARQVIEVHLPEPLPTQLLGLDDTLTCAGLLPGFAAPLREIIA